MTAPLPDPSVGERLVRIETKLDSFLATHAENASRQTAQHDDHETRIRKLERALWTVGTATAAGGGGIAAFLTKLLGG